MSDQDNQWIMVTKNKKNYKGKTIDPSKIVNKGGFYGLNQDHNCIEQQIMESKNTIVNKEIIQKFILKYDQFSKIYVICLGLGNFSTKYKPKVQFNFLKHCILPIVTKYDSKHALYAYDPVFTSQEKLQISKMNGIFEEQIPNETNSLYLYFMPHCEMFLYQKICQKKQKGFQSNIMVIGNSINEYVERCKLIKKKVPTSFEKIISTDQKIVDFIKEAMNDTYCYQILSKK